MVNNNFISTFFSSLFPPRGYILHAQSVQVPFILHFTFKVTFFRYPIVLVILSLLFATLAAIPPSSKFTPMSYRYLLRMGAININSNKSACYDSKVQHADFNALTHDLDVIGITETHSSMESDVQK